MFIFLDLLIGKEPLFDLAELPKLKSVAEWDGQDAKQEIPDNENYNEDL